jgi:hypothetical protein
MCIQNKKRNDFLLLILFKLLLQAEGNSIKGRAFLKNSSFFSGATILIPRTLGGGGGGKEPRYATGTCYHTTRRRFPEIPSNYY